MLTNLIKFLINKFKVSNFKFRQAFLFSFILNGLNIDLPEDASHTVKFAFGIFLLSLVCLFNFINIVGYLTSIILINKYNIEERYPKYSKLIRYFEKSSLFFVVFEGIMFIIFMLSIIVFSLIEMGLPFFK